MSKVRDIRLSDRRLEDLESPSKSDTVQHFDEALWLSRQPQQANTEAASLASDDDPSATNTSLLVGVSDPLQPLDFLVEGIVYHWSSGTLLQNVSYTIEDPASPGASLTEGFTDAFGEFSVQFSHQGTYTLTAALEATSADTKRIITSADALAALKLAVNLNPNSDPDGAGGLGAPPPSPYQYIAADVNGDGRVTSADALAILKIAVNLSDALKASWVFVPESDGYWDVSGEFAGPHGLSRSNVTWSKGGVTTDATYNTSANLVAVLLGDVNGSWTSSASDPNYLPDDYYELLKDPSPVFISDPQGLSVDENAEFVEIYTAQAIDEGANAGSLVYSLDERGLEYFDIDSSTGVVSVIVPPDYEADSIIQFNVIATDQGGNQTAQSVSVAVNNLDEAAPTITSGDAALAIEENSGANQTVYTATASDDADISGGVTFSLKAGSDEGLAIDADSGAVTLSTNPDAETQDSYSFTVVATDAAGNASEQALTLGINDLDEVAPTITSGDTATAIDENSGANQTVYTATASDDADVSGGVTFSLKAGSDEGLAIDTDSGIVTLSTNPDAETQDSYSFTVVATDAAGNASEQAVTLGINDLDEVAPTITSGDTATAIDENSGANQTVYTATATDDGDVSGGVTFSLKAGSDDGLSIDADSGAVTLLADPDFELVESYQFTVVVTDAAGNSAEQSVTLAVNNLDDTGPTFTSEAVVDPISENATPSVFYTASAQDEGDVTYGLVNDFDGLFSIDAQTGALSNTSSFDFETTESYSLTVFADDAQGNRSQLALSVEVVNEDDTAPGFTSAAESIAFAGSSLVYQASADDSADVSDGNLTYSLQQGGDSALLSIDAVTGRVSLASGVVPTDVSASYSFTIEVSDGVNEAVSQSVTVFRSQVVNARGPGVLSQGGLLVTSTFTDVVTLSVFVDPSAYGALQGGVSSIDFTLAYDVVAFEALTDSAVGSSVLDFYSTNTEEVGYLEFAGFESPTNVIPVDSTDPLVTIELTPKGTDLSAVSLILPLVNDIGFADTEFLAGEPVQVSGTEAPESFVLAGGDVSITGGAGADLFIITDATGSDTTIDDFEAGVDKIDMSLLLLGLGYQSVDSDASSNSVDGVATRYSDTSAAVLDLIAANDLSLDNAFGFVIEGDDGVIQGFYDADSNADSVDIRTFEITIGESESSLTGDDLQVAIGGFIA